MLKTAGMVLKVKLVSLKHNVPFDFSVVLETYKENPRNLDVKPLDGPKYVNTMTEIVYNFLSKRKRTGKQFERIYQTRRQCLLYLNWN